jgi:CHASE3 domain sensor protein
MKTKSQFLPLAVAMVLVGCSRSDQSNNEKTSAAPVTAKDVQQQYKDAAAATKSYVVENKDEFVASMTKKLSELDDKIAELAKKSEPYKDDAKAEADKALATLREQRQAANEQFEKAKQASADAWTEVKARCASAMTELEKAYDNVKAKFN